MKIRVLLSALQDKTIALLLSIGFLVLGSTTAFYTAYSVTSILDAGAGSLREAIMLANANASSTTGAPHTITFVGAGIGQINLASALPACIHHQWDHTNK